MLYFNFKDYEGFKAMFGKRICNNGKVVRQNKILLELYKSKKTKDLFQRKHIDFYGIKSYGELYQAIIDLLLNKGAYWSRNIKLMGLEFYFPAYDTDAFEGICVDGTSKDGFVRYWKMHDSDRGEDRRLYKMRIGRLFKEMMAYKGYDCYFPEQVLRWFEEEVTSRWKAYATGKNKEYALVLNDDFEGIYDSNNYEDGNFHSCMTNESYVGFYDHCVKAKAASLINKRGKIVARAVVFTEVFDENGKVWRLCERQYSCDESNHLKRLLVDALIEGGHIDGFKIIGASCHDACSFVDNNENSLRGKEFYIKCDIDLDNDEVPYMDSFKYLLWDKQIIQNVQCRGAVELENTSGELELAYDTWNEIHCARVFEAYIQGSLYDVSVEYMDDYLCYNGDYYAEWVECPECGERYPDPEYYDEGAYSALLHKDFCCNHCRKSAEMEYKKANWHYVEWEDDYVEKESQVATINGYRHYIKEYRKMTISQDTLDKYIEEGRVIEYEGEYYFCSQTKDGVPYGIEPEAKEVELAEANV